MRERGLACLRGPFRCSSLSSDVLVCAHNSEVLEMFCGKLKEHLSDEFYKLVGQNVLRRLWH